MEKYILGKVVDIHNRTIFAAKISIEGENIKEIISISENKLSGNEGYIIPGFIDSHCHIESTMLTPAEFGRNAMLHGTIASISDPHEIANVCGIKGLEFMIKNAEHTQMKIFFTLPSCVPSVDFEATGARINTAETTTLIKKADFIGLSEMMNCPGVIHNDTEVMAKIKASLHVGKPIDGHAPSITGKELKKYIAAGITTDHETTSYAEAEEKIKAGMKIQIREGSSAKSLNQLMPLISKYPDKIMFCTDDLKSSDLRHNHINEIVRRAVTAGYDLFNVLRAATINPISHYNLPVGLLRAGDKADFIIVNNPVEFKTKTVYINGSPINDKGYIQQHEEINNFAATPVTTTDIQGGNHEDIIGIIPNSLYTKHLKSDSKKYDILKIVCYNRYQKGATPTVGYIHGFGIKKGAFGSTIGHDSHNITVVGYDDISIVKVINTIVRMQGGIAVCDGSETITLPLDIAGLMSKESIDQVASQYTKIEDKIKTLGSNLSSPLMTLSFMSLPVIPSLKITASGLFDVDKFTII
ncbi:MAG: adenine deaminase [Bacteroidales bacterium]